MAKAQKAHFPSIVLPANLGKQRIVIQPNPITMGSMKLTAIEKNLFSLTLLNIKERYYRDESHRETKGPFLFPELPDCVYRIKKQQLVGSDGVGANITEIWQAANRLRAIDMGWRKPDGGFVSTGLLSYAEYDTKSQELIITVSDPIMKRIMSHTGGFTYSDYNVIKSLKGNYTKRFYDICKMNQRFIIWETSVEELKTMFQISDKYEKYGPFKNKVLEPARKEMFEAFTEKKSDVYFEYQEIKKPGTKKIESIEFTIISDSQEEISSDVKNYTLRILSQTLSKTKDSSWRERILGIVSLNYKIVVPKLYIRLRKVDEESTASGKHLGEYGGLIRKILLEDFKIS